MASFSVGSPSASSSSSPLVLALDMRAQMLEQVDHALAMLGAERDRLAEAERPGLEHAGLAGPALGLVGGEDDRRRLASAASGAISSSSGVTPARASIRNRAASASRTAALVCARIRPGRVSGSSSS